MEKLMPVLKTSDYRKNENLMYKEPLFKNSDAPIIAYGLDSGQMMMYATAKDEEDLKQNFQQKKDDALSNLKGINIIPKVEEAEGAKIAFVEGNEYASEKILDKDFMNDIAKKIGSDSLMVGIPFKGLLIAIDSNSPIRMKFPVIIKEYFDNPQQDRISDKVFLVQNGEIVAMAGDNFSDKGDNDSIAVTESKDGNYTIALKSKNIDELVNDVNISFKQIMKMIMDRNAFGGNITFHLDDKIPNDEKLIEKCNSIITQIEQNEFLQNIVNAITSNKVNFKFLHNGKLIAPTSNSSDNSQTESKTPDKDYSKFTDSQLDKEFDRILNIPNASTKVEALILMDALMGEYKKRGLELPTDRKKKNWWEFWK